MKHLRGCKNNVFTQDCNTITENNGFLIFRPAAGGPFFFIALVVSDFNNELSK